MPDYTLTQANMNASLEDICTQRGWNMIGSIGSTGKTPKGVCEDVCQYLRATGDFTARSTISPRPPVNVDGDDPPSAINSLTSSDPIRAVTDAFVGSVIEID